MSLNRLEAIAISGFSSSSLSFLRKQESLSFLSYISLLEFILAKAGARMRK